MGGCGDQTKCVCGAGIDLGAVDLGAVDLGVVDLGGLGGLGGGEMRG